MSRGRSRERSVSREGSGRVREKTEIFEIKAKSKLDLFEVTHEDLELVPIVDETRITKSSWCGTESLRRLWEQKSRMDGIFDKGKGDEYYR